MRPSVEDIQTALNRATQLVLDISKGVYQWNQDREKQYVRHISKKPSLAMVQGAGQGMFTPLS